MEFIESFEMGTIAIGLCTFFVLRMFLVNSSKANTPPGPYRLPIIGTLHAHGIHPKDLIRLGKKYGDIFSIYVGSQHTVVIQSYNILQQASKQSKLANRGIADGLVGRECNPKKKGILQSDYDTARNTRSTSLSIMRDLGVGRFVMEQKVQHALDQLMTSFAKRYAEAFDPTPFLEYFVGVIIMSTLLNETPHEDDPQFREVIKAIHLMASSNYQLVTVNQIPILRFINPFKTALLQYQNAFSKVIKYVSKYVNEHVERYNTGKNNDFTERYLKTYYNEMETLPHEFDRDQLSHLLRDLLFAGIDTSVTSFKWILICLANRPEIQEQLRQELSNNINDKGTVSLKDKGNLPYMEAVIAEVQRFYTIAPFGVPHQAREDTEVFGYQIPRYTNILFHLFAVHNDPKTWKDPENFRPQRFLDDDGNFIKVPELVPFLPGKRSCLGELLARQSLFLFTANIVRSFKILPPAGVNINEDGEYGFVYHPRAFEICLIPQ